LRTLHNHGEQGHKDGPYDAQEVQIVLDTPATRVHMDDPVPRILTDRALRSSSRDCVVPADASTLGRAAPARVFDPGQVTTLITDAAADQEIVERIRDRGVRAVLAAESDDGASLATPESEPAL